jgi:hypothetical protein
MTVLRKRCPLKNIGLIKHIDDPLKMGSSDSSDPKGIFMTLSNEGIGIKIEFLELVGGWWEVGGGGSVGGEPWGVCVCVCVCVCIALEK